MPQWPTSYLWPLLHSSSGKFVPFFIDYVVPPRRHDLLVPGPGQAQVYCRKPVPLSGYPSFDMLALRIDCRFVIIDTSQL